MARIQAAHFFIENQGDNAYQVKGTVYFTIGAVLMAYDVPTDHMMVTGSRLLNEQLEELMSSVAEVLALQEKDPQRYWRGVPKD